MQGPLEPQDPTRLRVSDADRHRVAEILREAAGEGRLDIEELEERLEAAYAAKTYADLVPITFDLPVHRDQPAVPPLATGAPPGALGPRHDTRLAIMGGQDRKGVGEVGPQYNAFALMAGITIDLRQARFASREVVINANAFWAGIDVIVNAGTRVSVEGLGIMGGFEEARAKVEPDIRADSPLVRVRGVAIMAGRRGVRRRLPCQRGRRSLRRR